MGGDEFLHKLLMAAPPSWRFHLRPTAPHRLDSVQPSSTVQPPRVSPRTARRNKLSHHADGRESKTKYDRQLRRIWGEQGQAALEKAIICLLNCGPTGSEALKNLVLGGVGSVTIVYGAKVEKHDLGNNFMLDEANLEQSRVKCMCSFLQELNDAVKAMFIEESPEALIKGNPMFFFSQFNLVIVSQLLESSLSELDKICKQSNIMLLVARSYGLTGLVRISLKEHGAIES